MKSKNQLLIGLSKSLLIIFFGLLLFSCNKSANNNSMANGSTAESSITLNEPLADETPLKDPSSSQAASITRKLIKEGNLAFETTDLLQTQKHIEQAIKKHSGYISSENESKFTGSLSRTIVIRVPAKQFDAFIYDATNGVDRFDTKDIQVKDVTEEFVDIQARLKTKKELEQRYLELIKKANKVSEILEIEKQMGELRADIEGTEGRLRYLDNQSVYSTISITYYKSVPKQTAFTNKFKEGFSNGWQNFVWFIVGLVNIWPFVLFITILILLLRRWWKRRKALKK